MVKTQTEPPDEVNSLNKPNEDMGFLFLCGLFGDGWNLSCGSFGVPWSSLIEGLTTSMTWNGAKRFFLYWHSSLFTFGGLQLHTSDVMPITYFFAMTVFIAMGRFIIKKVETPHGTECKLWRTSALIYVAMLALWSWTLTHNTKETYLSVFPVIFWSSIIHWKSVNTICTCIPHSLTIQIFQSSFWGYIIKSVGPLRHRRVIITIGWIKTSMN